MTGWLSFEKRWCGALFGAMIPAASGRPAVSDLDLRAFWALCDEKAPPLARLGLRAAVVILTFLPIVYGFFLPFSALGSDRRDAFLVKTAGSRFYLLRQIVVTVKTFAVFAYFMDAGVRERFET